MAQESTHIAVLTGDLVHSADLSEPQVAQAMMILENCARQQGNWTGTPTHFSRHRGDGWQIVLTQPHLALRSALMFRATLRATNDAFDSYIAMAQGPNSGKVGPDLNAENGPVFVQSGQALDALKSSKTPLRMVHDTLGAPDAAVILADHLFQGWTQPQAQAMALALAQPPDTPVSFSKIAKALGKSRQATTKAMKAAGFEHLELALDTLDRSAAL